MDTVLIVDDEKNYPLILSEVLKEEGYSTLMANSGQEALQIFEESDVDLLVTDMKMPVMDGIELLEQIKSRDPELPVIMMTAHGTVEKAVEAMQKGAYNYILKPFENERLILYVRKACALYQMVKENRRLRHAVEVQYRFGNIIGRSQAMRDVFSTIEKVAKASATVLLEGESGTGKELVAKSIHFNSPRRSKPLVVVNCSALAENLLESELFGHEKGAFTGAVSMKKGRFELADGGTIFLDEIGELSANLQVKLLRVIQEKTIERVGGVRVLPVDIRIIAATNRILKKETESGRFREDLYYRLNVLHLALPPLRNRSEDIRPLVEHFIKKYSAERKGQVPVTDVEPDVYRLFYEYSWPGNVRELENIIERALVLCPGATIRVSDLPRQFRRHSDQTLALEGIAPDARLAKTLAHVEKMMIVRALKMTGNVQSHAAKLLGIGKSGLNQKIKKFKLGQGTKP